VFGSVARGEVSERSDVDLMADFNKSSYITLVKIGSLQQRLSEWLGAEVELSSADWMREPVRSRAMREAVVAFRDSLTHLRDILEGIDLIGTSAQSR